MGGRHFPTRAPNTDPPYPTLPYPTLPHPSAPHPGISEKGGYVVYKANVKEIVTEGTGDDVRAVGARLADGRVFRCAPRTYIRKAPFGFSACIDASRAEADQPHTRPCSHGLVVELAYREVRPPLGAAGPCRTGVPPPPPPFPHLLHNHTCTMPLYSRSRCAAGVGSGAFPLGAVPPPSTPISQHHRSVPRPTHLLIFVRAAPLSTPAHLPRLPGQKTGFSKPPSPPTPLTFARATAPIATGARP